MKSSLPAIAFLLTALASCTPAGTDTLPQTSVLVQTMPARRQPLAETLVLYGEVAHDVGASENVSFARAVLITRLLVSAGQPVRRGQVLMEVVTDPNAATTYLQAQSAVELARGELKRTGQLAQERLATQSQLATARKALADAETALQAQRSLGTAPGIQLVRASRDGVVASLSAQQGDRIPAGNSVLQLSAAGAQRALLGAEPEDVARLAPGMAVQLFPIFGGAPVPAKISQVFGVINPQTRLVDVATRTASASGRLIPGLKVKGQVVLRTLEVWAVPRSAVLEDTDGPYLFQIATGKARRVAVQRVVEQGDLVGVEGKLDPALPVVKLGNYELHDGMPVRDKP